MSQETMEWLEKNTLIGFTDKRGNAWHYRKGSNNHYADAIPQDDVLTRLFNFDVIEAPLRFTNPVNNRSTVVPGRKAMIANDNGDVLGIFKDGYQGHGYKEWLLDNVSTIVGDELQIGSAGLLKNRAQAWVSIEMPESIQGNGGVDFRPNLLACTSFDGSIATTYKRVVTVVVCDNTLSAGLSEKGQTYKLKHTKYSQAKISDAREALGIIYEMSDEFQTELDRLLNWEVSDKQIDKLMDAVIPVPDEDTNKRGNTVAEKKREEILALYRNDVRAEPWNGTAFGVLQAFNTWNHHKAQVRKGAPRIVRNMESVLTDKMGANDDAILAALSLVTK